MLGTLRVLSFFIILPALHPLICAEPIELLRRAESGHLESQVNLAIIKSLGAKHKDAHYWYKRAAKQNSPLASRIVGLNHFKGIGTSKNPNIGKRWLERAAKLGDSDAMLALANYNYENNHSIDAMAWALIHQKKTSATNLPQWAQYLDHEILELANQQVLGFENSGPLPSYPIRQYKKISPKYQEIYLSSGDKYEGMTRKGIPNGAGKRMAKDGSYYIGEFLNGKEHGHGSWFNKQGIIVTQGLWKQGNPVFPKSIK